jgi:UDP:flavonoid glycosyltransferase YjiC (YdhE family)
VISCGTPGGETAPREIRGGFLYEWCDTKDTLVRLADVVVSRAGHTSICQFIQRRKPMILVPIMAQSEQEGNAKQAQSIGVGAYLKENEIDLTHFQQALEEVTSQRFKQRIREVSEFAARFDPISTVVGLLS